MDREKLTFCDYLWRLTQENSLEWTIVSEKTFEAKADGMSLILSQEVPYNEFIYYQEAWYKGVRLKVTSGKDSFTITEGWKGWKRIFQIHPIALMFYFFLREECARNKAKQKVTFLA